MNSLTRCIPTANSSSAIDHYQYLGSIGRDNNAVVAVGYVGFDIRPNYSRVNVDLMSQLFRVNIAVSF